jgi:hypothetical protein
VAITSAKFRQLGNCSTLPAGATCTATIYYLPTLPGTKTATLTYSVSSPSAPVTIALTGG